MDRQYTVEECYALCKNEPQCGGFAIFKTKIDASIFGSKEIPKYQKRWIQDIDEKVSKGSCLLYREGCTKGGRVDLFDWYDMKECPYNSKLFHY